MPPVHWAMQAQFAAAAAARQVQFAYKGKKRTKTLAKREKRAAATPQQQFG